jgi:hypothetical protein
MFNQIGHGVRGELLSRFMLSPTLYLKVFGPIMTTISHVGCWTLVQGSVWFQLTSQIFHVSCFGPAFHGMWLILFYSLHSFKIERKSHQNFGSIKTFSKIKNFDECTGDLTIGRENLQRSRKGQVI